MKLTGPARYQSSQSAQTTLGTIDIATAPATYALNALSPTDWLSGAGDNNATYFLRQTDPNGYLLKSKQTARDVEVDITGDNAFVMFRGQEDGSGLAFVLLNFSSTIKRIGVIACAPYASRYTNSTWGSAQSFNNAYNLLYINDVGASLIPGYDYTNYTNAMWTIGVVGMEMYIKWNGVEVRRLSLPFKQVNQDGFVMLKTSATSPPKSIRHFACRFLPRKRMHGKPEAGIMDARDFGGWREGHLRINATAGSIQVKVVQHPHPLEKIKVGDTLIVPLNGITKGNVGPFGYWPNKSYPDITTMQADLTQADGTAAAILDGVNNWTWVFQKNDYKNAQGTVLDAGNTWYPIVRAGQSPHNTLPTSGQLAAVPRLKRTSWYFDQILPIPGRVHVTAITLDSNGDTWFTIDQAPSINLTNWDVYYDNARVANMLTSGGDYTYYIDTELTTSRGPIASLDVTGHHYPVPRGRFAMALPWKIDGSRNSITIRGADVKKSRLWSPDGVNPGGVMCNAGSGNNSIISHIGVDGNSFEDNFGMFWFYDVPAANNQPSCITPNAKALVFIGVANYGDPTVIIAPMVLNSGLDVHFSSFQSTRTTNLLTHDCEVTDMFASAFLTNQATWNRYYRCNETKNFGIPFYANWSYNASSSTNIWRVNCQKINNTHFTGGFQEFQAGTGAIFENITMRNGGFSINSGHNVNIINGRFYSDSRLVQNFIADSGYYGIIITSNTGPFFTKGTNILGCKQTVEDYGDANGSFLCGIGGSQQQSNLFVVDYEYFAPDHKAGSDFKLNPVGIGWSCNVNYPIYVDTAVLHGLPEQTTPLGWASLCNIYVTHGKLINVTANTFVGGDQVQLINCNFTRTNVSPKA